MIKVLTLVAVAAISLSATSLRADLLGSKVDGSLTFANNPTTNYFDPTTGFVPARFGNHSSPNQVVINSGVEFGFDDGDNRNTANFSGTGFTVRDVCLDGGNCLGNAGFEMIFTDLAFDSVALLTNDLGVSFSFLGDTLTVDYPGNFVAGDDATATFSVGSLAQTPEPGTMALVATGILGASGAMRRRLAL